MNIRTERNINQILDNLKYMLKNPQEGSSEIEEIEEIHDEVVSLETYLRMNLNGLKSERSKKLQTKRGRR